MFEQKLKGIPETLLIPLWARAIETKRADPIIRDEYAVNLMENINYDFHKFEKAWMSQVGVSIRTELLDKATQKFIQANPDAVVINLGCGLDTRFFRVDNGSIQWYELDLPEPIRIRRHFFPETERYHMIEKSVFDYTWVQKIQHESQPVLIIAEGLLMYFTERQVKDLLTKLIDFFPHAEMLLEPLAPILAKNSRHHDSIRNMQATFKWGVASGQEVAKLNNRIRLIAEWNYFDYHRDRWRWMVWLSIPVLKKRFNNQIIHLQFV